MLDDNSLGSFLFKLVCVVVDVVFFKVPNEGSIRFRCYTVYFDCVVCQALCGILFVFSYFRIWLIIAP